MAFNLFEAPDYYGGLLGEEATQKLQNKALTTGLINAAIGYFAQPKNQGYGSALPYLGKALAGGYQAGQETLKSGLTDYETKQKIDQMTAQRDAIAKVAADNPELGAMLKAYPNAAPGVLEKLYTPKTQKTFAILDENQAKAYGLPTELGQKYQMTDSGVQLIGGTEKKEGGMTNDRDAIAFEKFGKPFNQLNQVEAGVVNKSAADLGASKAPKVSVNLSDPTAKAKAGIDLSERAAKFYQTDVDTANQFQVITDLSQKNPNPTGDTTLLYTYFKVLDPTSTVREGEINMVKENRSIPDKFKIMAQKLAGKGSLTQPERDEIYRQAQMKVETKRKQVEKTRKAWVDNAKRLELDPDLYVPNPYGSVGKAGGKVEVDY